MLNKIGIIFLLLIVSQANAIEAKDLAIIVNKANPTEALSLRDLGKIFKAEKQFWDGEKIHLLMREQGSWEKEVILKKVYQMSDEEVKKFWLGNLFRGEVASFPAVFGSVTRIKSLIKNMPGAIGFIDSKVIDDSLKVIKIEGKLPGEPGYPLAEE